MAGRLARTAAEGLKVDRGTNSNAAPPRLVDHQISDLQKQINKRWIMNLLIQGAAAHTFVTASHLVRKEIESLRPGLTSLHDRFAISGQLNYCIGEIAFFSGRPNLWWGFSATPQPPLRSSVFLAQYCNQLATEETRWLRRLGWKKWVCGIPLLHWLQFWGILARLMIAERNLAPQLTPLAKRVAGEIMGVDEDRLDASITRDVAFGNLHEPRTTYGKMLRGGAVGYSGVVRRNGRWFVVAKAWLFPLLVHELVKGTMELVCLHGLNELDKDVYLAATDEADQLEYESWCLQSGGALWRRLIALVPRDRTIAQSVMQIARLSPDDLESLMIDVMENPESARRRIQLL